MKKLEYLIVCITLALAIYCTSASNKLAPGETVNDYVAYDKPLYCCIALLAIIGGSYAFKRLRNAK